jgi:rhamnulokinase
VTAFAAADLGASGGRVVVGQVGREQLDLTGVHRFPNNPVRLPGGLHWDILDLYRNVLAGLRTAGPVTSIGIDSWAVDYGLLDGDGTLLGNPYHYRDTRTATVADQVQASVGPAELYRINGLQHLPFNTIYQLAADQLAAARHLLLIPDLLTYWLTGTMGTEVTNASTTGLLDATTGAWSPALLAAIGLDPALLAPLRHPGDSAGHLGGAAARHTGLPESTEVTAVASHDTASAVAAVPATRPGFAYISCGTWSLAGLELDQPVLTEASRAASFTNERGVDGTVRYLRNIMGLWLLAESQRTWRAQGRPSQLNVLLAQAAKAEPFGAIIDPDAPEFLPPGDVPSRVAAYCERTGQAAPGSPGAVVRCILDSLALAHRRTLRRAAELAGRDIEVIHLVGGGSRAGLLCQLTADATGLPVIAGPAEATAAGNILLQARAHGLAGDLPAMRRLVASTQRLRHYRPRGPQAPWLAAATRIP